MALLHVGKQGRCLDPIASVHPPPQDAALARDLDRPRQQASLTKAPSGPPSAEGNSLLRGAISWTREDVSAESIGHITRNITKLPFLTPAAAEAAPLCTHSCLIRLPNRVFLELCDTSDCNRSSTQYYSLFCLARVHVRLHARPTPTPSVLLSCLALHEQPAFLRPSPRSSSSPKHDRDSELPEAADYSLVLDCRLSLAAPPHRQCRNLVRSLDCIVL